MDKDILISVDLQSGIKRNNLCSAIVAVEGSACGLSLIDNTNTKNEQVYVIAALRDLADAMQAELNRPENIKTHNDTEH